MTVTLQGTNLDLTDELRALVDDKLEDCFRPLREMKQDPIIVDIELERTTRRYHNEKDDQQLYRAEANVSIPGRLIRVEESAPELPRAIVEMKHTLTREIRTWREKVIHDRRAGARRAKEILTDPELQADDEADEIWEEE
ncbi:MAG: hypothetical protein HKN43_08400 [Rhodothermales bacterium]|nr:hypothetical protein [Rhodothermales bacterium]